MYPSLTAPLDPSSLSLVVVASIGSRRSSFTVFGSGGKQGNAAWASTRNSAASMNCIAEVFDIEPIVAIDEGGPGGKLIGEVAAS